MKKVVVWCAIVVMYVNEAEKMVVMPHTRACGGVKMAVYGVVVKWERGILHKRRGV